MTTTTESDIKELKDLIIAFRDEIKADIKRIEIGQAEIKGDIKALEEKLMGEIKTVNARLDGLGKRLENQEFLSRSVVVGLVLAFAAGLVKLFFPDFPSRP